MFLLSNRSKETIVKMESYFAKYIINCERAYLVVLMDEHDGHLQPAAWSAGLSVSHLRRLLSYHQIPSRHRSRISTGLERQIPPKEEKPS